MSSQIGAETLEGFGAGPASVQVALGAAPTLDALAFGGLVVALIAAAALLVLNRDDPTRAF